MAVSSYAAPDETIVTERDYMMKSKRSARLAAVCVTLTLVVAACGSGSDDASEKTTTTKAGDTTTTAAGDTTTTAAGGDVDLLMAAPH